MSSFNQVETLSTVRFGNRAKHIKNKPRVNMTRSMREVEGLLEAANKQIARQTKVITAMQSTINGYRAVLKDNGIEDTVAPDDAALAAGVVPAGLEAVPPVAAAAAGAGKAAVDSNPKATAAAPVAAVPTGETALRLLELEDELADLKKKLEDRDSELKERQDEVLCLSASLLEKEQLLFGAGIDHGESTPEVAEGSRSVSRDALTRASHNLMLQELEGLQKVFCQVCDSHPFKSAKAVSDLIVLHEQSCFEATENRQLVKNLRQKNASLNAEVDALKGYIESGKVEDLMESDGSSSKQRRREMRAEISKLQGTVEEKEAEIERLKQVLVEDVGSSKSGSTGAKKKAKLLEQELDIKTKALSELQAQLATRTALVEDLENQLRTAGDASTVRELNHQLRQMVLVHRQLLRKFAVVDVECSETVMKLQARDQRIAELNRQVLRLNDELREQSEWSSLQLAQLRMSHLKELERASRKAGGAPKADRSSKHSSMDRKGGGRLSRGVVRPVVRSSKKNKTGGEESKGDEWGEV